MIAKAVQTYLHTALHRVLQFHYNHLYNLTTVHPFIFLGRYLYFIVVQRQVKSFHFIWIETSVSPLDHQHLSFNFQQPWTYLCTSWKVLPVHSSSLNHSHTSHSNTTTSEHHVDHNNLSYILNITIQQNASGENFSTWFDTVCSFPQIVSMSTTRNRIGSWIPSPHPNWPTN